MTRTTLFAALLFTATSMFAAADREASRPAIMIPVAGSVAGAFGTRFQTDLTLVNQNPGSNTPALVDVWWLPRDAAGTGTPVLRLELQPRVLVFFEDFVTRTLNKNGLGTVIFRTVHADGSFDAAGRIDAFARVWTPGPGGQGTTSQAVYASTLYSPPLDDLQPIPGVVYGLRQDAGFRSNYGLVNMGTKRLRFTVRFLSGNTTVASEEVDVEGQSMTHRGVPPSVTGQVTITVTPHQEIGIGNPTAPIQPWTAYGSSVDNITGDAWYSKAQSAYPHND